MPQGKSRAHTSIKLPHADAVATAVSPREAFYGEKETVSLRLQQEEFVPKASLFIHLAYLLFCQEKFLQKQLFNIARKCCPII
jgi:hypothetical protein